jgi:predicted GH43/DUF377 family glycosyl hydrolase
MKGRPTSRTRRLRLALIVLVVVLTTVVAIAERDAWLRFPQATGGWAKYGGSPVLGGEIGTAFDMSVLREGSTFRMWFSWRPMRGIALAESSDAIHWMSPTLVLGPNPSSGWEDEVNRPVVIKGNAGYQMWYTGQTSDTSYIGYATSTDGLKWTRWSTEPVMRPDLAWEKQSVMAPYVMWNQSAGVYNMWYSGGDQYEPDAIGFATSLDGQLWTKRGAPVLSATNDGSWEGYKVAAGQVLQDNGWYVMFYIGFKDIDHAQIGIARSRDGITGWQKNPANPIIRPGFPWAWDYDAVYKPFAVLTDDGWYLWYNGRHGTAEQIGLALHKDPDLGFGQDPLQDAPVP